MPKEHKPLFKKGPSVFGRFTLVLAVGVILLIVSFMTRKQNPLQGILTNIATPLYMVSDMPTTVSAWVGRVMTSKDDLRLQNNQLEAEALVLKGKLQKLNALSVENARLRELLGATQKNVGRVLLAEVMAVSPNPLYHYVMINKGRDDGVTVGQPVIDQSGLFGQVVEVAKMTSRVLLISDQRHAVPAEVSRNGLRVTIEGDSHYHQLTVPNVAPTSDVQVGDLLLTSGLGGLFPRGYPVATVTEVALEKGQDYLTIKAKPLAELHYARQLLLLFGQTP